MGKRGATTKGVPVVVKKIKTEASEVEFKASSGRKNEVLDKVKLLQNAFNDEEQGGLLCISNEARDLLQATISSVLGEGSAADERHPFQTRMANATGSTLSQGVKNGADKVTEAKSALRAAEAGHTEAVAALATAKSNLEERVQAVKTKKEEFDKSLAPVKEEEQNVANGESEVEKFSSQLTKKREDRDKFKATLTDNYEVLKAFEWESPAAQKKGEKKLLTSVESTLKKLKADSSMFVAIRNALTKAPAERTQFDRMAMEQAEQKLNGHLQGLEEQLASAEKTNAEKVGICAEAAANLEAAQKRRTDCKQEHDAAKTAKSEGEAGLREAKDKKEEAEVTLAQAQSFLEAQETLLTKIKDTIEAFTFLYERRINPDSAPCPSPVKIAVPKVEPTIAVEENPVAMQIDNEIEEPATKDSPAKGSPAKDSPAKGSPAKDSPAKCSPRSAQGSIKDSPNKDSLANSPAKESVEGAARQDSPYAFAGSPAKDSPAKCSPQSAKGSIKDSPHKDSLANSPAKESVKVAERESSPYVAECSPQSAQGRQAAQGSIKDSPNKDSLTNSPAKEESVEGAERQESAESCRTLQEQKTEELPDSAPMEEDEEELPAV